MVAVRKFNDTYFGEEIENPATVFETLSKTGHLSSKKFLRGTQIFRWPEVR